MTRTHLKYTGAPTPSMRLAILTDHFAAKDLLLEMPVAALAFLNTHAMQLVTSIIFVAQCDNVKEAFSQAAVAATSYRQQHRSASHFAVDYVD